MNEEEIILLLQARDEFSRVFDTAEKNLQDIRIAMDELEKSGRSQNRMLDTLRGQYGALAQEAGQLRAQVQALNQQLAAQSGRQLAFRGFNPAAVQAQASQMQQAVQTAFSALPGQMMLPGFDETINRAQSLAMSLTEVADIDMHPTVRSAQQLAMAMIDLDAPVKSVGQSVQQNQTLWQRFRQGATAVGNQLRGVGASARQAADDVHGLGIRTNFTWLQMLRFAAALAGVQLGISVLSTVVIGLRNLIIDTNANLETYTLQFETLTGSVQFATQWLETLREVAARTPFDTAGIVEASRQLEVFGGSGLNTIDNITMIGDAAAATQADINNLTFWVGRFYGAVAAGRPLGEALSRFQELGVLSPVARSEIEDLADAGAEQAEIWGVLTRELGRFEGAMEKQEDTWKGVTSTIRDSIASVAGRAFEPLFLAVKNTLMNIRSQLTGGEFDATIERWRAGLSQFITDFSQWFGETVPAIIGFFRTAWQQTGPVITFVIGMLRAVLGVISELTQFILTHKTAVEAIVVAYASWKVGTLVQGMYALVTATLAATGANTRYAQSWILIRSAMITSGIGALLVGLGVIIYLVSQDWRRAVNLIIQATNALIGAVEGMVNAVLGMLGDLVRGAADKFGDFLEILGHLPAQINPFADELDSAIASVNNFAENGVQWSADWDRFALLEEDADNLKRTVDKDLTPALRTEGRLVNELGGFYEDTTDKAKKAKEEVDELARALEGIIQSIQDKIVEAYIEGGERQAEAVRRQQEAMFEEALEIALALEQRYGIDLPRALSTAFRKLQQDADDMKKKLAGVSPLMIALAAIRSRTLLNSDVAAGRTSPRMFQGNTNNDVRMGPTNIGTININGVVGPHGLNTTQLAEGMAEGIRTGRFSEIGLAG